MTPSQPVPPSSIPSAGCLSQWTLTLDWRAHRRLKALLLIPNGGSLLQQLRLVRLDSPHRATNGPLQRDRLPSLAAQVFARSCVMREAGVEVLTPNNTRLCADDPQHECVFGFGDKTNCNGAPWVCKNAVHADRPQASSNRMPLCLPTVLDWLARLAGCWLAGWRRRAAASVGG